MPRLIWDASGERFYETGVDRGVLYPIASPGVAWSGLISVSESPTGGEPRPYYLDGIKYLNIASAEEFEATLEAFWSPPEFGPSDGVGYVQNGLFATQQPRKPFSLSYRTKIGNDVDADEHGYKIHLVYNALTAPSQRTNQSTSDTTDPTVKNWHISTLAPAITGFKPTAHLVIDSTLTDPAVLIEIEDLLYGSDAVMAGLPSPDELIAIFS